MSEYHSHFHWFLGVVEDVNDPDKSGRVAIRNLEEQKTLPKNDPKELFWAEVLMPPTGPNNIGLGMSPTGLERGTHVLCFYMDPKKKKYPVIMGSLGSFDKEKLENSSISSRARGDWRDTSILLGPEAKSSYAAEYPYNKTITTKSGHVIEIDDTPKAERIHVYHRSGSYIEMRPDGSVQTRTVKNHLDIIEETKVIYAEGNITIYSNGGMVNIQGDGDVNLSSKTGKINIDATEVLIDTNLSVSGDIDVVGKINAGKEIQSNQIKLTQHIHSPTTGLPIK